MTTYLKYVVFPPALFFVICLTAAAITITISVRQDNEIYMSKSSQVLDLIFQETTTDFAATVRAVGLISRMVSSWRDISPEAFSVVTLPLVYNYGLAGCAYTPKVMDANRTAFEKTISTEFGRKISIVSPLNVSVPEPARPFYFPYSRHSLNDTVTIGVDNWVYPERRDVMIRAATTASVQLSLPSNLTILSQSAILAVSPVYDCPNWKTAPASCGPPANATQRLQQASGFGACAVGFVTHIPKIAAPKLSSFGNITDVSVCLGSSVLYQTNPKIGCEGKFSNSFDLGGQTFYFYATPKTVLRGNVSSALISVIVLYEVITVFIPALLFMLLRIRHGQVRLEVENSRNEERERAKVQSEAMKTLLRCTSHDMRAPLQACINAVGLLRDELKKCVCLQSELRINLVNIILGSTTFLEAIMNNILDTSKLETETLELVEVPTKLTPKIQGLFDIIRTASLAPDEVELNVIVDAIPIVMCDASKILRMLMNLVSNSAKFTKTGSITVKFACVDQPDPDIVQVFIEVKDTGCGMTEEQLSKLGTPYVHSSAKKGGGTGLGIYICKSYAEMYGGVFNVQSTVGQGTSISFTLTFNKVTDTTDSDDSVCSNHETSIKVPVEPLGNRTTRRKPSLKEGILLKVLYCEDHPVTRKMMKMMLEKMGCSVDVAVDGLEASQKIVEGGPYDVVFMDMQMPHKNGDEVVRDFRSWESSQSQDQTTTTRIPIIALTGNAERIDIANAKNAGCDYHLSKPTRSESIQQVLEAIKSGGISALKIIEANKRTTATPRPFENSDIFNHRGNVHMNRDAHMYGGTDEVVLEMGLVVTPQASQSTS